MENISQLLMPRRRRSKCRAAPFVVPGATPAAAASDGSQSSMMRSRTSPARVFLSLVMFFLAMRLVQLPFAPLLVRRQGFGR